MKYIDADKLIAEIEKRRDEALQDALTTLRQVLNGYGEPKSNINTIVNAFNEAMKANKSERNELHKL